MLATRVVLERDDGAGGDEGGGVEGVNESCSCGMDSKN